MFLTTYNKYAIALIVLLGLVFPVAHAAPTPTTIENVINAFDAGQTQQRLPASNLSTMPALTSKPAIKKPPAPSTVFPQGEKIHIKLKKVIFKGNTVFTKKDFYPIFANSINKTISLNQLQSLVEQVTNKYRQSGYILSRAYLPPQEIKEGVVHVEIIEGYISQIHIKGKTGIAHVFIKKYSEAILKSRPLNNAVLEHSLLLANDLPGINVKAVITPSTKIPDSADLTLYTSRKIVNAYAAYDNYGTRYLGPQEISYGVSFNSILLPGDSNAFHFMTTSRHKEVQYAEFVHTQPLGAKGLNWALGANYTETRPGFVLTPAEVVSRSTSFYSNFTYPLIRSRTQNLNLNGQANYQNVDSTILGFPFYQDRFRTLGVGGDYATTDRWRGYDTLSLNVMHGFTIWGANPHFYQSRPKGQPCFTLSTFTASRVQPLSTHFSFYAAAEGQYSWNVLLATEQFGYGGPNFGRGYDPYAISGDRGMAGKMELRFQLDPEFRFLETIQFYVFYDGGMIWNIDSFDLPGRQDATSAGGGTRIHFMNNLDGEFFIGKPLTMPVAALLAIPANGNQARAFFQLVARV